jgi:hypothetical protein
MADASSTRLMLTTRSPDANNKEIVYDVYQVLRPLYGNSSSPRALQKTMCQLTWVNVLLPVNELIRNRLGKKQK